MSGEVFNPLVPIFWRGLIHVYPPGSEPVPSWDLNFNTVPFDETPLWTFGNNIPAAAVSENDRMIGRALTFYLHCTKSFRSSSRLFCCLCYWVKGQPVTAQHISHWISDCIELCYDLANVSLQRKAARSTRVPSILSAFLSNVPIADILQSRNVVICTYLLQILLPQGSWGDANFSQLVLRSLFKLSDIHQLQGDCWWITRSGMCVRSTEEKMVTYLYSNCCSSRCAAHMYILRLSHLPHYFEFSLPAVQRKGEGDGDHTPLYPWFGAWRQQGRMCCLLVWLVSLQLECVWCTSTYSGMYMCTTHLEEQPWLYQ